MEIRANSILPARREDIELHTADGLTLVGELARPVDRLPSAAPQASPLVDRLPSAAPQASPLVDRLPSAAPQASPLVDRLPSAAPQASPLVDRLPSAAPQASPLVDRLPSAAPQASPLAHTEPVATLVCLHPLPTHGGMMDSHVLRKAAWRLPALAGVAVLRFNTRGTSSVRGTSDGSFDRGVGERYDVAAAIEYAEFAELPSLWVLGWSFGTDLALRYGNEPSVVGTILLSPPLRSAGPEDLAGWAASGRPVVALVPEFDDYLRPDEARERFAAIPQAEVIGVPGAKHLWVGDAETALNEIVRRVAPAAYPLPETWDGPMEYGDASAYADRTVAAFTDLPRAD